MEITVDEYKRIENEGLSLKEVSAWCGGEVIATGEPDNIKMALLIKTPKGKQIVWVGDWVIKDTHGGIWPWREDVAAKQHKVED